MLFLVTGMLAGTESARAEEATEKPDDDDPSRWLKELDVTAGSLEADLKLRELELRDGVRVRLSPYYLRSERIHLSLTPWGVRVVGDGVLTFCPCDDPPLSIGFSGGYAGPPDELIVEDPTLRVFGLPVFWLPYLWLRSPRKIGLTMPTVSFRGADGLFLGQGLHLPIGAGMELAVGAYTRGGFASTLDFATTRTLTLMRFDFRSAPAVGARDDLPSGVGLSIDAHGDVGDLGNEKGAHAPSLTWDVDAIRGARGLRTTLELEPLARPYDRASALARLGPLALGVDVLDRRGEALDSYSFAHPYAGLAFGGGLGTIGAATFTSFVGPRIVRFRRADWISDVGLGVELGTPFGVFLTHATTQVDARGAHSGGGPSTPEAGDGRGAAVVAEGKLELSLPLARRLSLVRAAGGPPVLHIIEPLLRFSGVAVRGGGDREALAGFIGTPLLLSTPSARDAPGALDGAPLDATTAIAGLAALGARSSIGAMSGGIAPGTDPWIGKLTAELSLGVLAQPTHRDAAFSGDLRFDTRTTSGSGIHTALSGALARSMVSGDDRTLGWLALGRFRWDTSREGLRLELRSALRGELPVLGAWALLGADAAPRLATITGLYTPGTTAGIGAGFPIGLGMRLGGDVDAYADRFRGLFEKGEPRLLDVHGTFRYRHPCGCFRFGLRGGHVVGREGIDVFANLELAQVGVNDPRDW